MGEIRSTMDIIMEKAKGLTMTEEEKEAFRKKETEGKVRGLFQRFLDGFIDAERLKDEIGSLGEERYAMAREALIRECMGRMEPGADNTILLDALENAAGLDIAPIRKIILDYNQDLEQQKMDRKQVLQKKIKGLGISGSAVIPNIHADQEWIRYLPEMNKGFQKKLKNIL
ncbi:MAG: hypothetical protein IMF11_21805 [Proteobacteria bacterium]|nr:hypothetical protein [Pseudomonadota bacterium]